MLFFAVLGIYKGLVKSVFSVLGLIGGLFLGHLLSPGISTFLAQSMPVFSKAEKIIFALIFIIIYFLFGLAGNLVSAGTKMIALGSINSILGGIFGLIKAVVVLLLLTYVYLFLIDTAQSKPPEMAAQSILLPRIVEILHFATRLL